MTPDESRQIRWKTFDEMHQIQPQLERRAVRRFDMRLAMAVTIAEDGSGELHTETQNISAGGLFFYLERNLAAGAQLDAVLTLPPQVTLTDAVRVRLHARVVRVQTAPASSRVGIAAVIENHEFLRSGSDLIL